MKIDATPSMCAAVFAAIERRLSITPTPPLEPLTGESAPVFVTLKKSHGELRGCIGTFASGPLAKIVPEYGERASFHDQRFKPLQKAELYDLVCTVSVLHSFERVTRWNEWAVGVHGVRISGSDGEKAFSATFLPKVAQEQRWDHRSTMVNLLRKAGAPAMPESEWDRRVAVERYQHSECTMSYREYRPDASPPNRGADGPRCTCA
mmetsp:Transcript_33569/g.103628  ORF Transcript_33569/g.103628 Transcript_33569/m.103628 type:complete len:206 (+) Transcript_33569:31-648(+)|eukprot:CAMPEP_0174831936 /NCGR_PEP_ID=MMETSP1114-20130205/3392_1 /TAXON_ID=312471 /ORGANISM="Neobodo designis, Strain CCAP 1951/1" /LENGTH=205 /DNA_ID=CAMNT_0016065783 /DNA_START=30 /DNA_END=644 /DNA_ORIENTATION=-